MFNKPRGQKTAWKVMTKHTLAFAFNCCNLLHQLKQNIEDAGSYLAMERKNKTCLPNRKKSGK